MGRQERPPSRRFRPSVASEYLIPFVLAFLTMTLLAILVIIGLSLLG